VIALKPEELNAIAKDWDNRIRPLVTTECTKATTDLRKDAIKIVRAGPIARAFGPETVHLDEVIAEGAKWLSQFAGEIEERAPYLAIDLTPDGKIQVTEHGCHIAGHGPFAIDDLKADEIKELIDSFVYAVTS
jgi:hypothetical protein